MAIGSVTAVALNLRASPDGAVTGILRHNCRVQIVGRSDGWLNVSATQDDANLSGWVSASFVALDAPTPAAPVPAVPPLADDDNHRVTVQGNRAIGPGGDVFATRQPQGFYSAGRTPLVQWLAQISGSPGLSPSVMRVLQAVSANEGDLEAVNSYDNAFMSFGLQQWTLGTEDNAGELPALLEKLKSTDRATFDDCFGRYGLDVELQPGIPSALRTGYLKLNGTPVNSVADKNTLRSKEWAYRYWRAGHFEGVRSCQAALATERIQIALAKVINNRPISEWLTSEHGVALLLDEHVNRPGHVPGTLQQAVDEMLRTGISATPEQWGDDKEAELIHRYVLARDDTPMTDPDGRARKIAAFVQHGALSDTRGSFKP
jgi:hypothetical protein